VAAGFRTPYLPLGLSSPKPPAGYRSLLAFWMGGGYGLEAVQPPIPPTVALTPVPWPWMRPFELRRLYELLREADEEELPVILAAIWIVLWHD
jgi:hypothetical protein